MFEFIGSKVLCKIVGTFIPSPSLICELMSLTLQERMILKKYSNIPNHQLTKEVKVDSLIRKSIVIMATQNRALLTEKGLKIKSLIEQFSSFF